mmetsp:Transcript_14012/g.30443  ORF Transcript_14012/g.30443 Transcript_14012/m.30443 type:complete len:247 (+) Transcript_14012:257-997(+)
MLGSVPSLTMRGLSTPCVSFLRCLPTGGGGGGSAATPVVVAKATQSLGLHHHHHHQKHRGFATGSRSPPEDGPASVLDVLSGINADSNANSPAVAATAATSTASANAAVGAGAGRTSGARRSTYPRAEKTRSSRRRRSYLDLLQQLRGQHFELTDQVGNMQFWSIGDDTRWRFADEPQYDLQSGVTQGPVWRLPASVDESRAIVDPDLYEIEVQEDQHGRCIVKVVQVGGDAAGFTDSPDEGEDPV